MSMKNSSDTIGNRTRNLPACSAVVSCMYVCVCVCVCVCIYIYTHTHIYIYIHTHTHTHTHTHILFPCSTVLLEQLTGSQPVKKFPTFYGTRRFITAFTSARQLSLSWASSIHSMPPNPTSWRSILTTHLILLYFITRTIFGEQYRSLSSTDH